MKIIALSDLIYKGTKIKRSEVVEIPDKVAKSWISLKIACKASEELEESFNNLQEAIEKEELKKLAKPKKK